MIVVLVLMAGFEFCFLVIVRNAKKVEYPDIDADGNADIGFHDSRIGFISTFNASESRHHSRSC